MVKKTLYTLGTPWQQQPPNGPPPRSAPPQGHIVNLGAPDLITQTKNTRSISVPQHSVPGLAIHVPDSMSRQSSQQSKQQESLQQLQLLKQELLGQRQEIQASKAAAKQMSSQSQISGVPAQSPYTLYKAGDMLKSPLACLTAEYMEKQINDNVQATNSIPAKPDDNKIDVNPVQPPEPWKSAMKQPKPQSSPATTTTSTFLRIVNKASTSIPQKSGEPSPANAPESSPAKPPEPTPPSAPLLTPQKVPAFDIQKSLEKQLGLIPGSRLPETSVTSFDDHSYIISSGTKSLDSKYKEKRLDGVVSVVPCESLTEGSVMQSTLSKASKKRSRRKQVSPQHRADTVRLTRDSAASIPTT
jgi:hypothetical protein